MSDYNEVVKLDQNTPEWLAMRKEGLGASDAPVIMRVSPFQGPFALWLNKTGQTKDKNYNNEAQQHGHDNEPKARELYIEKTGHWVSPKFFRLLEWPVWADMHWKPTHLEPKNLMCSADGFTKKANLSVEIKCPISITDHLQAREGRVPDHYYPQIQHNMIVTGAAKCDYASFFRDELIILPVELDMAYCTNELLPELDKFWGWVKSREFPIPPKGSTCTFTEAEQLAAADQAAEALGMMQAAQKSYDEAKAKLYKFCAPYAKSICGDVEITQTYKKGFHADYMMPPTLSMTVRRVR